MNSSPLRALHEFYDKEYQKAEGCLEQQYDIEKARATCVAYVLHYGLEEDLITRGIELPFSLPLLDSQGNAMYNSKGDQVFYTGKIDWLFEHRKELYLSDHKTKSKAPSSAYWSALRTAPQLLQYFLAAYQSEIPIKECLWDVLVKATIKPKKLTKKAKEELSYGEYEGEKFDWEVTGEEVDETPKMFGHRYRIHLLRSPSKYFFRQTIKPNPAAILDHHQFLIWCHKNSETITSEQHALKNGYSCMAFSSLCDYHPICADGDKSQFQQRQSSSSGLPSGGWSDTRCSTFMRCRRLWWYKYKERLERTHQPYISNLVLGDYTHRGLEFLKSATYSPERQITFGAKETDTASP